MFVMAPVAQRAHSSLERSTPHDAYFADLPPWTTLQRQQTTRRPLKNRGMLFRQARPLLIGLLPACEIYLFR